MDDTNTNRTSPALASFATVKETADLFGVDPSTVRRWIAAGVLSAVRIGKTTLRVDPTSLKYESIGAAA